MRETLINGSKTAVMYVTGFLCVSLGSSTVQIHDSLVADVHARVPRLVSVVKMAAVLEGCNTEEQRFVARFLWGK
jgi:hypothetical protein